MKNSMIEKKSHLLKALANNKRLEILDLLVEREYKVGELEQKIGLSQSSLSQHLAILRNVEIVSVRRQAQSVYYSLKNTAIWRLLEDLEEIIKL